MRFPPIDRLPSPTSYAPVGYEEVALEAVPDLEEYLRSAPIRHAVELQRPGGGHQFKQLVVLDGGFGAVAKLAEPSDGPAPEMIRGEVAGWLLAHEVGVAGSRPDDRAADCAVDLQRGRDGSERADCLALLQDCV